MNKILLVFVQCIMLVMGQVLWKIGLRNIEIKGFADIITLFFNKFIFSGLVLYGVATLFWFYIIKNNDLNSVYPLQSMSYVLSLIVSYYILGENITLNNIIGSAIIIFGVLVIARG